MTQLEFSPCSLLALGEFVTSSLSGCNLPVSLALLHFLVNGENRAMGPHPIFLPTHLTAVGNISMQPLLSSNLGSNHKATEEQGGRKYLLPLFPCMSTFGQGPPCPRTFLPRSTMQLRCFLTASFKPLLSNSITFHSHDSRLVNLCSGIFGMTGVVALQVLERDFGNGQSLCYLLVFKVVSKDAGTEKLKCCTR